MSCVEKKVVKAIESSSQQDWPHTNEQRITEIQNKYFGPSFIHHSIRRRERRYQGGYAFLSNYTDIA